MSTLFFEGFNIKNSDDSAYLDPSYWSRPFDPLLPKIGWQFGTDFGFGYVDANPRYTATEGTIRISGYRIDTPVPEIATPLQLSGISGLDSDQLYISFRVAGLSHAPTNTSFPHSNKFLSLCDGDNTSLAFEVVRTSGATIQGGSWSTPLNSGMGISVKQSGVQIGLFDLRVDGIALYDMGDFFGFENAAFVISTRNGSRANAFMHLEFCINRANNTIALRLDGLDVYNRLIYPYVSQVSGNLIGSINNLKFYGRAIIGRMIGQPQLNYLESYGMNTGALQIDDLVIVNNSGDTPRIWVGPSARIYHLNYPINNQNFFVKNDWDVGGDNNYFNALLNRDGDNSYLYSDTSGEISSVFLHNNNDLLRHDNGNFTTFIRDGIGGIRLFNDVRKISLDSEFINVYATGSNVNLSSSYVDAGEKYTLTNSNYIIKNSFIFKDPTTSEPWTSGTFFRRYNSSSNVTSGVFGIKKL
jgi:hypothetical protein